MLNLKAALISLLLGSSSVAMAAPSVTFSAAAQGSVSFRPTVRDHRVTPAYSMPAPTTAWIALSAPASLRSGRVVVRDGLTNLSQLRLQASRGMSYIRSVELRFRDGSYQTLAVNRWLTTEASIDLNVRNTRRKLDSITVVGSANRSAKYMLFGQTTRFEAPVYQPPVYQPPVYQPPVSRGYSVGQNLSFVGTDGRREFMIGADKGAFNTLRLQGATGSAYIAMASIEYTDGTAQFLSGLHKTLAPGETLDFALDGYDARTVKGVTVWCIESGPMVQQYGTFNVSLL